MRNPTTNPRKTALFFSTRDSAALTLTSTLPHLLFRPPPPTRPNLSPHPRTSTMPRSPGSRKRRNCNSSQPEAGPERRAGCYLHCSALVDMVLSRWKGFAPKSVSCELPRSASDVARKRAHTPPPPTPSLSPSLRPVSLPFGQNAHQIAEFGPGRLGNRPRRNGWDLIGGQRLPVRPLLELPALMWAGRPKGESKQRLLVKWENGLDRGRSISIHKALGGDGCFPEKSLLKCRSPRPFGSPIGVLRACKSCSRSSPRCLNGATGEGHRCVPRLVSTSRRKAGEADPGRAGDSRGRRAARTLLRIARKEMQK